MADANTDRGTPRNSITMNAITPEMNTSVPADARKSSRYVSGYGAIAAATGGERRISGTGLPSDHE